MVKPKAPPRAKPSTTKLPSPSMKSGNGEQIKVTPKASLPVSIVNALPSSLEIMKRMAEIAKLIPGIEKELAGAKKTGAIPLARSFVAFHRMNERISEILKPLSATFELYKTIECPQAFEAEGITNVPLSEGFRVGMSSRLFASILPDKKEKAYDWLRANGFGDLIGETVNAGTLSAAARSLMEEHNKELPEEMFKVVMMPNTSVTVTK